MRKTLALMTCLGLTACVASMPSESALCREVVNPRDDLNAGLLSHPETAEAVGKPAVDLIVILSVCEGVQ